MEDSVAMAPSFPGVLAFHLDEGRPSAVSVSWELVGAGSHPTFVAVDNGTNDGAGRSRENSFRGDSPMN